MMKNRKISSRAVILGLRNSDTYIVMVHMKYISKPFLIDIFIVVSGVIGSAIFYSFLSPWAAASADSTTYLRMAEEMQKGHWHIDHWIRGAYVGPPVFPALVALVEWVIPGFEKAGTLVAIVSISASVIPVYLLSWYLYGRRSAIIAITLTIFNAWFYYYGLSPLTDSLFTAIFLSGILLTLLAYTKKLPLLWFAAGISGGLALLTRDAGIILPLSPSSAVQKSKFR